MADTAGDIPVLIFAGEFVCVGAGVNVRRAICITLKSDRGQVDGRSLGEPLFEFVILRFALS